MDWVSLTERSQYVFCLGATSTRSTLYSPEVVVYPTSAPAVTGVRIAAIGEVKIALGSDR